MAMSGFWRRGTARTGSGGIAAGLAALGLAVTLTIGAMPVGAQTAPAPAASTPAAPAAAAPPAGSATPRAVNPTASAVQEDQLLQALRPGGTVAGRVSIPDPRAGNLIQPEGRTWRDWHQGVLPWVGAISILGMLAGLVAFYLIRGRIELHGRPAGRTITRFASLERFAHWLGAVTFIVLALTGVNLVFGRAVILPLFGENAFSTLTSWGKLAHNYLGFPFMLALVLMLAFWVRDNIPNRLDLEWIKAGGGFGRGGAHVPAKRFNAGQKVIFWSVIVGGAALSVSGLYLLFPEWAQNLSTIQTWQVVHGAVAMVLTAVMIAHIYIGSIGMEGAFDAMGTGQVDLTWAREHHSLWADEQIARERAGLGESDGKTRMMPAE